MSLQPLAQAEPTLIFIPDISGFSRFVKHNEIQHSQHIVEELLEAIIDANDIGLEISEIEGDAVLFYRQGVPPTSVELLAQIQRMYVRFHGHLKRYETHRICQCGACSSAHNLALKFIVHFGEISQKHVRNFTKLFGNDLIIAHRLMKNEVELEEYVLFTHQLLNACSAWVEMQQAAWDDPREGEGTYDGETVKYCYLPLEPLKVHVPEPRIEDYSVGATAKALTVEGVINAPMEMVFDVVSDVSFRHRWIAGLQDSGDLNGKITRAGSSHRCVMGGSAESDPAFISHKFELAQNVITWIESEHKAKWDVMIKLERIGKQLTRIYYIFFVKSNPLARLKFRLNTKHKMAAWVSGNFVTLDAYCKELLSEQHAHPAHIVTGLTV
ncbi:MAG: DUF2652 domain-containing protein [Saprospiraceae bacterium]|nr:DUF2652 domain-containing protein [Saprospiraceae bacterium]